MASLIRRSSPPVPVKLSLRGRMLVRYARWRGPVGTAKTGVTVVRHRRGLRRGAQIGRIGVRIAAIAIVIGAVVAIVSRQRDTGVAPVT